MADGMKQILTRTKGDKVIWGVVLVLSFISLLAVYSSTGSLAYRMEKNSGYYLAKQVMVLGLGLLIVYYVHRINYTRFAKWSVYAYLLSLPLLPSLSSPGFPSLPLLFPKLKAPPLPPPCIWRMK
jgi:cell division protein FtsW